MNVSETTPSSADGPTVDLSRFRGDSFARGAGRAKEALWMLCRKLFFEGSLLPLYGMRTRLLRAFGAKVGSGVVIKPGVKIVWPWRLVLGDNVWLGDEVYIICADTVTIGSNVCVSQRAFLVAGGHDWSDPCFRTITKPIVIEDGVWVCASAFVANGVTIGRNAVATAGSVVTTDLPPGMICSGNPCRPVKKREFRERTEGTPAD